MLPAGALFFTRAFRKINCTGVIAVCLDLQVACYRQVFWLNIAYTLLILLLLFAMNMAERDSWHSKLLNRTHP